VTLVALVALVAFVAVVLVWEDGHLLSDVVIYRRNSHSLAGYGDMEGPDYAA